MSPTSPRTPLALPLLLVALLTGIQAGERAAAKDLLAPPRPLAAAPAGAGPARAAFGVG